MYGELRKGDVGVLSRAITLVESQKPEDQKKAEDLLDQCLPHAGNSVRIGITGVPGVGKSTFIEAFGKYLIKEKRKKVAILAVDPSSNKSRGSILGDKTRMSELTSMDGAFIRPSPSSGSLGGVGLATREIILLCETSGYDVIIVETVGVGQSETEVKNIVDFFLLLLLPGAGDELQGIKRGIIELADAILINKSDGDNLTKAKQAKAAYQSALHLFPPSDSGWSVPVDLCSAVNKENIDLSWTIIEDYIQLTQGNGYWSEQRKQQLRNWFYNASEKRMLKSFHSKENYIALFNSFLEKVTKGESNPRKASRKFIERLSN